MPQPSFGRSILCLLVLATLLALTPSSHAQDAPIPLTHGLVAEGARAESDIGLYSDAVAAALTHGPLKPTEDAELTLAPGRVSRWKTATADAEGFIPCPPGAALYIRAESDDQRIVMLEATGHALVYVNGVPRAGDPQRLGFVRLPILLEPGANDLIFIGASGSVRASLTSPRAGIMIDADDATVPDLVLGESGDLVCGIVITNATSEWADGLVVQAQVADRQSSRPTELPRLPPLSCRKCRVVLPRPSRVPAAEIAFELFLRKGRTSGGRPLDLTRVAVRARFAKEVYTRGFVSQIDDSVQTYAIRPPSDPPEAGTDLAAVFAFHDQGQSAFEYASSFAPREWAYVLCPSGRRPYAGAWPPPRHDPLELRPADARLGWSGFTRVDAAEVVGDTQLLFRHDPSRVYLVGLGVGGYGAWQLAALEPDRFAALGVSGGWFDEADPAQAGSDLENLLRRPTHADDAGPLLKNLEDMSVYVLHGADDKDVPAEAARRAAHLLGAFHRDFTVLLRPGAGHRWDASDENSDDSTDWAPMFDLFARRILPPVESRRTASLLTAGTASASRRRFATIHAQLRDMEPSSIDLRVDAAGRRIVGATSNVALLSLDGPRTEGPALRIRLDGQDVELDQHGRVFFRRAGDRWTSVSASSERSSKNAGRVGPFAEVFRRRFVLVYGTVGTPEQTQACLAKARFDAESFWVRCNGSPEIVADETFTASSSDYRDRNVLLYGNESINSAWDSLMVNSPIRVADGRLTVGTREMNSPRLAACFVRPRPDGLRSLVGAVAWTGEEGRRAIETLPSFGVVLPDYVVFSADSLQEGPGAVLGAGFFGPDWALTTGESAWRDKGP
jgi:poly(3-hydroxybutyrate) depolymerase